MHYSVHTTPRGLDSQSGAMQVTLSPTLQIMCYSLAPVDSPLNEYVDLKKSNNIHKKDYVPNMSESILLGLKLKNILSWDGTLVFPTD